MTNVVKFGTKTVCIQSSNAQHSPAIAAAGTNSVNNVLSASVTSSDIVLARHLLFAAEEAASAGDRRLAEHLIEAVYELFDGLISSAA